MNFSDGFYFYFGNPFGFEFELFWPVFWNYEEILFWEFFGILLVFDGFDGFFEFLVFGYFCRVLLD